MEILYENVKHDELNIPVTVSFSAEYAKKIVELMKESDVKCIVNSDENKTDITFSIDDIEKLNKLLQPIGIEKQLNNSAIQLHKIEKKEKLIPIANAISNLYTRKINSRNSCIDSHKKHIDVLSEDLKKCNTKIQALKGTEVILAKTVMTFPVFKVPVNALIKRNEKKIERLNNDIPKLENQIQIHQTTIEKLTKSAERYKVRKNACKHLSEVIKSFSFYNKKDRNQNYLTALLSLNGDIQQINSERIKSCIETVYKLQRNFSELPLIRQQKAQERISNLLRTKNTLEEKNKILQAAQPDISAMLARLNDNKITERIDRAAMMFNQTIENRSMSLDSVIAFAAVENSCAVSPTAAEIAQVEINILGNINDKDGDMIPDRFDNTFNLKVTKNNESPIIKEETSASDTKKMQSENTQMQKIRDESDDNFDAMLEKYKDQIPPNDYDVEPPSYVPDDYIDTDRVDSTFNPEAVKNKEKANKKSADSSIHLVTEEQLKDIQEAGIKPKINHKGINDDGKIPIRIEAKDKEKFNSVMAAFAKQTANRGKRL